MFYSGLFVKKDEEIEGEELIHKIKELLKLGKKVKVSTDVEISAVRENAAAVSTSDSLSECGQGDQVSLGFTESLPSDDIETQLETVRQNVNGLPEVFHHLKLTNASEHKIAWQITRGINRKLFFCNKYSGVLEVNASCTIKLNCHYIFYTMFKTEGSIEIGWINYPEGNAYRLTRAWFKKNPDVRKKMVTISYDPNKQE